MTEFKDYREQARRKWGQNADGALARDDIQFGCLLRIADATEKMAENHAQLVRDAENYKAWYEQRGETITRKDRTISALRGVITRMKRGKA